MSATHSEEGLHRGLTRWHALAVVVGGMLGTGIYIRPASVAQILGSVPLILSVWIAAGTLSLAGALTYAELAARIPRSGGEYAFLRVTLGELPAFLFGWMRLTVSVGTVAALAVAATVLLSDLVSLSGAWIVIVNPFNSANSLVEIGPRQMIAVLLIVGLAVINIRGVGEAGQFQSWITTIKALGLLALIIAIVVLGHAPSGASTAPAAAVPVHAMISPNTYGAALLGATVAYKFFALNAFGLLLWRHRNAAHRAPVAAWRRWMPYVFLAGMLWLIVETVARGSVEVIAALVLIGAGFPVDAWMRYRRQKTTLAATDG